MRTLLSFLLLSTLGTTGLAAPKTSITLTRDGAPAATIVLGATPTRAAQLAAYEVQWHIQQITGATLPIIREGTGTITGTRLLIGDSTAMRALALKGADFPSQQYLIRFLPNTVLLLGKDKADTGDVRYDPEYRQSGTVYETWPDIWDEQGTLYAAYDFLERCCGVRWFNPTDSGIVLPHRTTLTAGGSDVRRTPAFRYRGGTFTNPNGDGYDAWTALWPAGSDGFKAYEQAAYPELHQQYPDSFQYTLAKRARVKLFLLRMRAGGEKTNCNHSLYAFYDRFWTQNPKNPTAFEAEHKDWFAQGYSNQPPQMCYTNPGLVKQVATDAANYFDHGGYPKTPWQGTYPGYHWGENFFAVEPMDNASFCKCAACQKWIHQEASRTVYSTGRDSDYFFQFVNAVAKEVLPTHPNKHIVTLAYATHAYPPTMVKLDPRVAVQICFAANRNMWCTAEYRNDLKALEAWVKEDPNRPLYLWLYYTFPVEIANNGKFHCFPGFFAHTIDKQFKLFARSRIRGMFHCGYGQEVEAYITFKLMDNPTLNADDLLRDYFAGLYGHAAEPMRELYQAIEATYSNPANYPADIRDGKVSTHQTVQLAWGTLGTAERMAHFATLLEQAKAAARTAKEQAHIRLFELSTWSYMTEGRRKYVERSSAPIPAVKAPCVSVVRELTAVPWARAAGMGGWYTRGGGTPAPRALSGRVLHDGTALYLELTDPCDPTQLVSSSEVFPYDDWELYIASQCALPYRQFAIGPTGRIVALSHGEINFRTNVPLEGHGVTASTEMQGHAWVTRIRVPFSAISAKGVKPGDTVYLNIIRVTSPAITKGPLGIDSWVPYTTVHEIDRLGGVTLE
jgi:hypothetical protein